MAYSSHFKVPISMSDETISQLQNILAAQYDFNDVHTNARVLQEYKSHHNTSKGINVGPFTAPLLTIYSS